jgi:uncharacterized protein (TIGR02646 family)
MIKKLPSTPVIPKNILDEINSLKPFTGGEWDIKDNEYIQSFKTELKTQLLIIQDERCAYCGLPLGETGKTEIEHFAPKGGAKRPKHTEFSFTVENLVLSCNLCNSPIKKGMYDTISQKKPSYQDCTFKIVHPYFDEHDQHYGWVNTASTILIQGISAKGRESIRLFELDSSRHTEARVRLKIKAYLDQIPGGNQIIAEALAYRL